MSPAQVWWPSPRSSDGRQRAVLVSATAQELLALDKTLRQPKLPWPARKHLYLAHVRELEDIAALRVSLADKLHNLGSMVADHRRFGDELFDRFDAPKHVQRWYYEQLFDAFSSSPLSSGMVDELAARAAMLFTGPDHREQFEHLLRSSSTELAGLAMIPSANPVEDWDLALFFEGLDHGLVTLHAGGRFDTLDRQKEGGRWGLLAKAEEGGWYNAEYLPQVAAYVEAIVLLGYPAERVQFELPPELLQLDLAVRDAVGRVVVLGEAKRDAAMLDRLLAGVLDRFVEAPPGPDTKSAATRPASWPGVCGNSDRRFSGSSGPASGVPTAARSSPCESSHSIACRQPGCWDGGSRSRFGG